MILAVSACALLGVLIIPMVQGKRATNGQLYKYVYALMIALGASALFCDAILHLIPEVSDSTKQYSKPCYSEPH